MPTTSPVRRRSALRIAAVATAMLAAPAAHAQEYPPSVTRWLENCRDQDHGDDDRARHCEVRPGSMARGTRALRVDGRQNGGVRFIGWDRDSVAVFALVQTHARTAADAREMASEIRVVTEGRHIRTVGTPDEGSRRGHSVSYHVYVPRRIDLEARTHNGGISAEGVGGSLDFEAHNGGLSMKEVGGDLRGRTTNGGITLTLSGARWDGRGVDLQTTNGGVSVSLPERFNGRLETSTVNGGFDIDFPITMQGRIGRNISATLGSGGPLLRVVTTNGGVRIRRS